MSGIFWICEQCRFHNNHGNCANFRHTDDKFYCQCPVSDESHRFLFFLMRIRELEKRLARYEEQQREAS